MPNTPVEYNKEWETTNQDLIDIIFEGSVPGENSEWWRSVKWSTSNGREISIRMMDSQHLVNAVTKFEDRIESALEVVNSNTLPLHPLIMPYIFLKLEFYYRGHGVMEPTLVITLAGDMAQSGEYIFEELIGGSLPELEEEPVWL